MGKTVSSGRCLQAWEATELLERGLACPTPPHLPSLLVDQLQGRTGYWPHPPSLSLSTCKRSQQGETGRGACPQNLGMCSPQCLTLSPPIQLPSSSGTSTVPGSQEASKPQGACHLSKSSLKA